MPLSPEKAREGAAYNILFERVGNPDNCTTPEQLVIIRNICQHAVIWSTTQDKDVSAAYKGAAAQIVKRAADRLENHLRYSQLIEARKALPEPPVRKGST